VYKEPFLIRRLGRTLLWPNPALYRWIGRARGRGDCYERDFDLWIDGYPRSANTFAVESFRLANPNARILSHRHIPSFIIHSLAIKKPGIFLIRKPQDAVVSWTIFWNTDPGHCLDYYIDFHQPLLPYASQLFVASFEHVTTRFGEVIEQFNRRFGTQYTPVGADSQTVSQCLSNVEQSSQRNMDGAVNELRVCRPSEHRSKLKPDLLRKLRTSPVLMRKLERANELHAAFATLRVKAAMCLAKPGNTQALPQFP
jgi:hypothetical protein